MDRSAGQSLPRKDLPPAFAKALAELERLQEDTLEKGLAYFSAPAALAAAAQRRYYEAMTAEVQAMLRLEKARRVEDAEGDHLSQSPESAGP